MTTNTETVCMGKREEKLGKAHDTSSWYLLIINDRIPQTQAARKVLLKARSAEPSPKAEL